MPTYEYACKSCGDHLEVVQGFHDNALTMCPTCEGPLRKVFGNIAISFKGTGFYSTDNRSVAKAGAGNGPGDSASDSSAVKNGSGGSSSSESGVSSDASSASDGGRKSVQKSDGTGDSKAKSDTKSKNGSTTDSKAAAS